MSSSKRHFHYLPLTDGERQEMLATVGAKSVDELFNDIPEALRNPTLRLPLPISEVELKRELGAMAAANRPAGCMPSFLGAGAYNHFIPSIVGAIISRGEFLTAYTPYQAEASQGTLQAMYEFQSLICQLLGMDVANTGMYDGATAMAEAALMACRVTGRDNIAVLDSVSPAYRDVLHTYANPQGINISIISQKKPKLPQRTAALLAQHPNYFGYFERLQALGETAHQEKAFFVVSVDPIAIALFPPPSEYDADIVTAEAQPLGIPLSFGGPYVGLFTTKAAYMRQLPGRIVGKTTDAEGRTGYVLTLQTREQHIRRERATSNICTSEALAALAVTIHLAAMGPKGLRAMSELCYHKAHYAATNIALLPGYNLPFNGIFFREFVVQCPIPPSKLNTRLLENGIIGGLDISNHIPNGMLLCVTEMNTRQEIDTLVTSLKEASR